MSSTLNIYVAKQFFLGILTAFVVIAGVIMLIDFVELSRNFSGVEGMTFGKLLVMTGLKAPSLFEEIIPFVVLFGVMNALVKLNRRSELIIMRAAGLSAWRFLLPGLIVAGLIGVFWAAAVNPLAAKAQQAFNAKRSAMTAQASSTGQDQGRAAKNIWLAEGGQTGQTKIYAPTADLTDRTLTEPTFYLFRYDADKVAEFTNRFDAKQAVLSESGYWELTEVVDTPADGSRPLSYERTTVATTLTADDLRNAAARKKTPAFWGLPSEIRRVSDAGFSATPLILHFHRLLALPLTLIAMAVIAAGASMQLTRLGGTMRLMIIGAALGFGVYFANNMITAFGETGSLPAILSAWAVPVFVLLVGLARLSWLEDG